MTDVSYSQRPGPCPPDVDLAAFVGGDLTTEARAAIVKHAAWCDDCRDVLATTALAAEAREAPPAAAPPWFRRRGIALGFAAALVAGLAVSLMWSPRAARLSAVWRDIEAAQGDARSVDARLSGPTTYHPVASPTRSAAPTAAVPANFQLESLVGRLREAAGREPSSANLHAYGVSALVLGGADDAVRALSEAAARDRGSAPIASDLAAAFTARARQGAADGPRDDDWRYALEAAQRACEIDASLAPAWFNLALALDGLGRSDEARRAWQHYADAFPTNDGWRAEALRRLLLQVPN